MSTYRCEFGTNKSKITNFWASSLRKFDVFFKNHKYLSIYLVDFGTNKSKLLDFGELL